MNQLFFDFLKESNDLNSSYDIDKFIISDENIDIFNFINNDLINHINSQNYIFYKFIIYGNKYSGKTYLANIFKNHLYQNNIKNNITLIDLQQKIDNNSLYQLISQNDILIIENLDLCNTNQEKFLFEIINQSDRIILFTSSIDPKYIKFTIRDLQNRTDNLHKIFIKDPTIEFSKLLIEKYFIDLNIDLPHNIISYIVNNINRNYYDIISISRKISHFILSNNKKINFNEIKEIINQFR